MNFMHRKVFSEVINFGDHFLQCQISTIWIQIWVIFLLGLWIGPKKKKTPNCALQCGMMIWLDPISSWRNFYDVYFLTAFRRRFMRSECFEPYFSEKNVSWSDTHHFSTSQFPHDKSLKWRKEQKTNHIHIFFLSEGHHHRHKVSGRHWCFPISLAGTYDQIMFHVSRLYHTMSSSQKVYFFSHIFHAWKLVKKNSHSPQVHVCCSETGW